ncbi:MAG: hypothetical protein H0V11_09220 [Actinobacteria bacterium]|nr:hypothetical protein [Actinomycetota bacterium]
MRGRFPFATLMAVIAGVVLLIGGDTMWAIVFFVIAALFGALTLRSVR